MSIKNDLQELTVHSVIDQATADRISDYYRSHAKQVDVSSIISVVAALFVGGGLIFIVAYNWDSLPMYLRLLFGFLPLALASCLSYYVLRNHAGRRSWTECASVLQSLSFAASFALINQVYQIQMEESSFFAIVMLFSLPFVFVMRSATLSLLALLGAAWSFWRFDWRSYSVDVVVILSVLVFLYDYYIRRGESFLCALTCNLLPFILLLFALKTRVLFCRNVSSADLLCLATLYCSILFGFHTWISGMPRLKAQCQLARVAFYPIFFTTLILSSFAYIPLYDFHFLRFVTPFFVIAASLVFKQGLKKRIRWQEWISMPACLLLVLTKEEASVALDIFALSVFAYAIYEGMRDYDLLEMNCGVIALFVWAVVLLFQLDLAFYTFGALLVAFGLSLFAMNFIMVKRRKKNGVAENK